MRIPSHITSNPRNAFTRHATTTSPANTQADPDSHTTSAPPTRSRSPNTAKLLMFTWPPGQTAPASAKDLQGPYGIAPLEPPRCVLPPGRRCTPLRLQQLQSPATTIIIALPRCHRARVRARPHQTSPSEPHAFLHSCDTLAQGLIGLIVYSY